MVKDNITNYANRVFNSSHDFRELSLSREKILKACDLIKQMPVPENVADSLAMGPAFYSAILKEVNSGPKAAPSPFMQFNGLRFYLDESVPPNECEVRNHLGVKIASFVWGSR